MINLKRGFGVIYRRDKKNKKDIIEIVIPEKSSFYVCWDEMKK